VTGLSGEIHRMLNCYCLRHVGQAGRQDRRLLVFQVNATRDHKVAICADDPALRIPDLAAGEWG